MRGAPSAAPGTAEGLAETDEALDREVVGPGFSPPAREMPSGPRTAEGVDEAGALERTSGILGRSGQTHIE